MEVAGGRAVARLRLDLRAAFGFRLFLMTAIFPLLLVVVAASKSADIGRGIVVAIGVAAVVMLFPGCTTDMAALLLVVVVWCCPC